MTICQSRGSRGNQAVAKRKTAGGHRGVARLDHTEGPPNGGTSSLELALGRNRDVVIIL